MINVTTGIYNHHGLIVNTLKNEFIKVIEKQGIIVVTKTLI